MPFGMEKPHPLGCGFSVSQRVGTYVLHVALVGEEKKTEFATYSEKKVLIR